VEERGGALGTISSVGVDRFEIKKADGSAQIVMVDDQTRYPQEEQEIQLEDLKPGDRVFVRGRTNANKEFVAVAVRRITDAEAQRFQNPGERAFGEIVSIDKNQIRIRNPRQGEQTVVVNDQTEFMKQGQPLTLKDLKVGDRIFAMGKETQGQFLATRVLTGHAQGQGQQKAGPER
jgi:preprotein translocase subunit YajC